MKKNILDTIIASKKKEMVQKKKIYQSFIASICHPAKGDIGVIAEIKLKSPSGGRLGSRTGILEKVKNYKRGTADCISIVTENKFFADALLLIAKLYKKDEIEKFIDLCNFLEITPIVEVYDEKDVESIGRAKVVGVNARNLQDFTVDIENSCKLIKKLSKKYIVIGFSGIKSREEVELYKKAGAKAVLVGTSAMRSKNASEFIRSLKGL